MSSVGSITSLSTCETSPGLLAGVLDVFFWVTPYCPTYRNNLEGGVKLNKKYGIEMPLYRGFNMSVVHII